MNTKLLHRLAWKEVRTLRPLWLTLFVTAVVLQVGLVWVFDTHHAIANGVPYHLRSAWLIGVLVTLPAIFAVAGLAMSFAGEREEGTDQFLCRLAAPPLRLLGVKIGLCVVSTAVMFVLLYVPTMLVALLAVPRDLYPLVVDSFDPPALQAFVARLAKERPEITVVFHDRHADGCGCLEAFSWPLSVLSFGVFFSLLFRRVFSSLIATVVATWLLPVSVSALCGLILHQQDHSASWIEWAIRLGMIPGALLLSSVWLVQTWDEDRWPRFVERLLEPWRRVTVKSERLTDSSRMVGPLSGGWRVLVRPFGLCWPDEWLPAWRREVRRLLWLEWRSAWRVMAFVLAAFGVYVVCQGLFVAWGSKLVAKEFPFVVALVSFVFGAWSFQAQQSGQRFRDFAGHGASPMAMWFIKQGVWFTVTLLTVAMLTAMTLLTSGRDPEAWPHHEIEILGRALGYGVKWEAVSRSLDDPQLLRESFGSLFANVVLAVGLCFAVGQLVSLSIARAVTAATVGFVVSGLAFGWQQWTAYLAIPSGLAVFPLIVGLLLASAVRMTDWLEERNSVRGWLRVIAAFVVPSLVTLLGVPIYRVVEVPLVTSAGFHWSDIQSLNAATRDVSPDAKQTAQRWIRLAESLDDEPIFLRKVSVETSDANAPAEEVREFTPNGLWALHSDFVAWAALKNREWLTHHADHVREAERIATKPDCAFDPEIFEGSDKQANFRFKRLSHLAVLLKIASEAAIADGKLDEGLVHLLVLLRLSEHIQQHSQWNAVQSGERLEIGTWNFLLRWARHPSQTGDSLRAALGRSPHAASHPLFEALKKHVELLPPASQLVVEEYSVAKQDIARDWRDVGWPAAWIFWERQREERLLDYSAAVAIEEMHGWLRDSRENWQGDDQLVLEHRLPSRNRMWALFLQSSTWNPSAHGGLRFLWGYSSEWQRAKERGEASAWRRGLIATIALRAYQLDHGRWPTQWDELIGSYLDRVPVDPWNGLPFELRPQGYPFEIEMLGSRIPSHTPLFVCHGQHNQRLQLISWPPAIGETSPATEWLAVSSFETQVWPPKDRGGVLSLIAFPLNATVTGSPQTAR